MRDPSAILTRGLFFSSVAVAAYALFQIIWMPWQTIVLAGKENQSQISGISVLSIKPAEQYVQPLARHSLFYVPKASEVKVESAGIQEVLRQYEVTGIIQGDESEALVQDRATKQTYFAQPGEMIGPLKLVDVRDHVIVVEYQGETAEMKIQEA